MADYQLTATEVVIRNIDGVNIPNAPGNKDWDGYQAWLALGNVPDPYIEPPPPPPALDANARLDAGIAAALGALIAARDAIHAIPNSGAIPARFDALLVQLDITSDALAAMLQAQAA